MRMAHSQIAPATSIMNAARKLSRELNTVGSASSGNWRVGFEVPWGAVSAFEDALEPFCEAITSFEMLPDSGPNGLWRVEGFSESEPAREALSLALMHTAHHAGIAPPQAELVFDAPRDWLMESYKAFHPATIGRYFVYGSHVTEPVPTGRIGLLVDAATAFGSGRHASTRGCLLAFDGLAKRSVIRNALDMGCGSGILAIAIAKTHKVPVLAADIDPESVRVSRFNAKRNGVSAWVRAVPSVGFANAAVGRAGPFDLIAANILARPLAKIAKDVARHLTPGGRVVLAGLLATQEMQVANAYRAQGLRLEQRIPIAEWVTLVMRA